MFVFKAAVLGAGTMGGEIAQVIASADVPVVMKDVKQELVDAGLEKAREVTQGQLASLVAKEKITQEQADARCEEILGLIAGHHRVRGLRRRRLRRRGGAGEDGDQAGGVRRARRADARPRDPRLQHLGAVDLRDRLGDHAARQGGRLPLLLSRLGDAADRGGRGRGHLRGDGAGGGQLRDADPQEPDSLRRGARLRGQPGAELGGFGDLALPGRERRARPRRSTRRSPRRR